MDLTERLADIAAVALVAFGVIGEAVGKNDGSIDRPDRFERGDLVRIAGQAIAAPGALFGVKKALAGQFLEDFGEQGQRNVIGVGDVLSARGGAGSGQVLQRDQRVIGLFC